MMCVRLKETECVHCSVCTMTASIAKVTHSRDDVTVSLASLSLFLFGTLRHYRPLLCVRANSGVRTDVCDNMSVCMT